MRIQSKYLLSVLLASATLFAAGSVMAKDAVSFVKIRSNQSYSQTVGALKQAVSSNRLMVMGHINQANVLSMTGLKLAGAESFLVGNPQMGKKAFSMNPAVGAVIPARIYIWSNQGKVWIGYFKPSSLMTAISPKFAKMGGMFDMKLHAIAAQAAR